MPLNYPISSDFFENENIDNSNKNLFSMIQKMLMYAFGFQQNINGFQPQAQTKQPTSVPRSQPEVVRETPSEKAEVSQPRKRSYNKKYPCDPKVKKTRTAWSTNEEYALARGAWLHVSKNPLVGKLLKSNSRTREQKDIPALKLLALAYGESFDSEECSEKDSSRLHVFCLDHEQRLRSFGGVHMFFADDHDNDDDNNDNQQVDHQTVHVVLKMNMNQEKHLVVRTSTRERGPSRVCSWK
ncbi:hypothetical protein HanRHA438_Chr02g0051261 [Helianthus annuus]|nr:hypothetical protein HanIR_Chr02g0056021 [Helianthus annuus]KAJ0938569.1 hypothetical protein HanRHA438_Chr02g0051261 [Helianthus annuus]